MPPSVVVGGDVNVINIGYLRPRQNLRMHSKEYTAGRCTVQSFVKHCPSIRKVD